MLEPGDGLQLAGDYAESDKVVRRFLRQAQGKHAAAGGAVPPRRERRLPALAAEKNAERRPTCRQEPTKHNDEAIKRYAELIEKYPEHAHVNLARHGLGMAHYRKGDLEKAQKALEASPPPTATATWPSCRISSPTSICARPRREADDAVAAGKLEEKSRGRPTLLEGFVGAAADHAAVPDALLKLGYCQQRMAKLLAEPAEQTKMLAAARGGLRAASSRSTPSTTRHPQATFERAKVLAHAEGRRTAP